MRIVYFVFCISFIATAAYANNPLDDLEKGASTAEQLIHLGNLNIEANRDAKARQLFKQAEFKSRTPVDARLGLAEIKIKNSDLRRAKYACRLLEKNFPKSPVPRICFGRMWLKFDRSGRALEEFESVKDSGDVRAIVGLAETRDIMNEYEKSIALYKEALSKGAGYEAAIGLGLVLERKGDRVAALKSLEKAVEAEPNSALALYHLGRLMQPGKKAAEYIEKALILRSDWADAYGALGNIWLDIDLEKAAAAFEKAISLEADRGAFHIGLGSALFRQKKIQEARGELTRALELVPNHIDATLMLSEVELELGNTERAIQLAEMAVQISPNNADICFQTAMTFFRTKRYTQANAHFLRTLSMMPENSAALIYMGDIACERRMYAEGIERYNDALKGNMKGFSKQDIDRRIRKCAPNE